MGGCGCFVPPHLSLARVNSLVLYTPPWPWQSFGLANQQCVLLSRSRQTRQLSSSDEELNPITYNQLILVFVRLRRYSRQLRVMLTTQFQLLTHAGPGPLGVSGESAHYVF